MTKACLLAVGARTSVGATGPATAAAVRAGMPLFKNHDFMIDRTGLPMVVAADAFLPPELQIGQRLQSLALSACQEAMAALAGNPRGSLPPISALIGLAEPRPGLDDAAVADLGQHLQHGLARQGHVGGVHTTRQGHGAGLMAMGAALLRIRAGSDELYLAGGVDSYLEPETLEWLEETGQLHGVNNTWGFIPGEAACFWLLTSDATARKLGFEPQQWLRAVGVAREAMLIKTDTVCLGEGLSQAVALAAAGLPEGSLIDQGYADFNGEPYRGDELGYTLVRNRQHFADPAEFMTPADCWGDIGAASGPACVMLASQAARKGHAKGPRALACTSSEGGLRTAALTETTIAH